MSNSLRVQLLSQQEIDSIYEKCLTILSTHGVKVDYEKGLKFLDSAGAEVNFNSQMVKFPVDMIESALKTVPQEITVKGGLEKHDFIAPDPNGSFYTTTCVQTMLYHNPENVNDMVDFVVGKILDSLEIEHDLYKKWQGKN